MATLLFDLLTNDEELDRANVFDVDLLADRLSTVAGWAAEQPEVEQLPLGLFGASTGAAAALAAAAAPEADIAAVVSRGGRPDLAGPRLGSVRAPTRLIVGSEDSVVLSLNREARQQMRCESDLSIVEGATHLFEEPGTLARAAELARDWFATHFLR
jgi:putative phosphoribosyl transferase